MTPFKISHDPVLFWSLLTVLGCWFTFAFAFLLQRRPERGKEQKRDPVATLGILLQVFGYGLVWTVRRGEDDPFLPLGSVPNHILFALAAMLAVLSVWTLTTAVKVLGKQWSVGARLIEGHSLISSGPYAIVRHPIYSGMLGMLMATGLLLSPWEGLILETILFSVGLMIRVRREELLLLERFGEDFSDYARRVPPVLPRISLFSR